MSLLSFLTQVHRTSKDQLNGVVLGNSSADLDSVCSSVCFAYLLSKMHHLLIVPMINIPQEQWKLRLDVNLTLRRYLPYEDQKIEELFLFRDSQLVQSLFQDIQQPQQKFSISLVDHNEVPTSEELPSWFVNVVHSIVDHHEDTKALLISKATTSPKGWQGQKIRWIPGTGVGSCASLIATLWQEALTNQCVDQKEFTDDIRMLLLSTIVKDTLGLTEALRGIRWGPEDEKAVKWLNEGSQLDIQLMQNEFESIKSNRELHRELGIHGMLLMDMKLYQYTIAKVAYSSMTIPLIELHQLFDTLDFKTSLSLFLQFHNATMVILMSCSTLDSTIQRYIALYIPYDVRHRDHLIAAVTTIDVLQLEPIRSPLNDEYLLFKQGNIGLSRKIIEPMIRTKLSRPV